MGGKTGLAKGELSAGGYRLKTRKKYAPVCFDPYIDTLRKFYRAEVFEMIFLNP